MNVFGWIFSLVFLLVAALVVFLGVRKGRKFTWMYSVARIVVLILSVILSVVIAKLISSALSGILLGLMGGMIGEVVEVLPSAPQVLSALVTMFLAPILFFPLWLIIRGLMTLLVKPLTNLFMLIGRACKAKMAANKAKKAEAAKQAAEPAADREATEEEAEGEAVLEEAFTEDAAVVASAAEDVAEESATAAEAPAPESGKKLSRKERKRLKYGVTGKNPVGMICGGICAFLVMCVYLIPVSGALDLVGEVLDVFQEMESTETEEQNDAALDTGSDLGPVLSTVLDLVDGLCNNVGTKTVNFCGGKLVYDQLASGKLNGSRVYLSDETEVLTSVVHVSTAMGESKSDPKGAADALRGLAPAIAKSRILPTLAAEFLAGAGEAWSEGEPFCGMDAPAIGEGLGDFGTDLWLSFKDSNEQTVKEDMTSLLNIAAAMIEHQAMDTMGEDPMAMLHNEPLVEALLRELLANDRLNALVGGLVDFGMESALETLEVRPNMKGAYDEYLADFTGVTENGVADAGEAARKYVNILNQYGVPYNMTQAQMEEKAAEVLNPEHPTTATTLAQSFVSSQEDMEAKSLLVTIDEVITKHGTVSDPDKEAKTLARAFAQLLQVVADLDQSNPQMGTLLADFGPAMDCLAESETIGYERTTNFLFAFLQSKSVRENCYFTTAEASDVAEQLLDGTRNADGAYVPGSFQTMMLSLGKTVDVLTTVSQTNGKVSAEDMETLLSTMTPATAEVIKTVSTPSVIEGYGTSAESATEISGVIGDIFTEYAQKNQDGTWSEEQKKKEADAMTHMMNIMLSDSTDEASTVFGTEGALGVSANEYVDTLFDSEILSDAVLDMAYNENDELVGDPMNLEKSMKDEEKAELMGAFNTRYQNAGEADKAETEKMIRATASVMNMNVQLSGGEWVLVS